MDPIPILPPELTSQIFSYLSPEMLIEASKVARAWRDSTTDGGLWKKKFLDEGWELNMDEVIRFEKSRRHRVMQKSRSRKAESHAEYRAQKRRTPAAEPPMSPRLVHTNSLRRAEVPPLSDQQVSGQDEEMPDADARTQVPSPLQTPQLSRRANSQSSVSSMHPPSPTFNADGYNPATSLILSRSAERAKLNFHAVYKQKRRLEENWNAGRYKSFQLPHKDYPGEAHSECVYTIQYHGNYLVSGSRDRTLRIWNLETQRLVREPLRGHIGSVLCVQFDSSEKEDIIISGSSDTNVILWQFSTGKKIHVLEHAHRESVLNLKFDERFLVTCSKDKLIKIWNRQELRPGDRDYPVKGVAGGGKCPSQILDLSAYSSLSDICNHLSPEQMVPLRKYTRLMTLDYHGAAVNAVHIYKDQLVSASGDRTVKVWDIHTGVCTALCLGHTKGIACVQYDGKRIVSGSSDNTIRIYDPVSQAEVACLTGHTKLVRTVQASFNDAPCSREELSLEARSADEAYFEARRSGIISDSSRAANLQRGRNDGSRRPQDLMATGASLPPGGGGSMWGRIVSGSYDETIIIWKKEPDGRWVPGHTLRQADALRASGGPILAHSELAGRARQREVAQRARAIAAQAVAAQLNAAQANSSQTDPAQGPADPTPMLAPPPAPAASGSQMPHLMAQMQNQLSVQQVVAHAIQTGAVALQNAMPAVAALQQLSANPGGLANPAFQSPQLQAQLQLQQHNHQATQPQATDPGVANPSALPAAQPHQHAHAPVLHQAYGTGNVHPQINARIFKLQFDARRIICCSQDVKIVGWDFANGDEQIIECSRFFGAPTPVG
jgi:F-box and WD-40 domain protein 1/11